MRQENSLSMIGTIKGEKYISFNPFLNSIPVFLSITKKLNPYRIKFLVEMQNIKMVTTLILILKFWAI